MMKSLRGFLSFNAVKGSNFLRDLNLSLWVFFPEVEFLTSI
jgi:hypothetical protein